MTPGVTSRMTMGALLFLIGALIALSAIPLDVMLPSFPALAEHFGTDTNRISLSISLFAVGFSVAQLFVGPFSDKYGRKIFLMVGLVVAIVGAIGCMLSSDYVLFLAFRVVQSIGCACFVLAQAIVQDAFKGQKGHFVRIFVTTFGGVCISCSPLIGTVLQYFIGWRGSFVFFVFLSLMILVQIFFCFIETAEKSNLREKSHFRAYIKIFSNKLFVSYSLIGTLAFSCHFSFIIVSPLIFLVEMKMTAYEYSLILLFYGAAYVLGGIAATYISRILDSHKQIIFGLVLMMVSAILMGVLHHLEAQPIVSVLVPMLFCTAGTILIRPATATEAMTLFDHMAGTAAAAASTLRFIGGGVVGAMVSTMGSTVVSNLFFMILITVLLSIIVFSLFIAKFRWSQI